MNDNPIVEDLLTLIILLHDIDIVDENIIGELAWQSVQKYKNTVRLLRYNNHIWNVNENIAFFQSLRCPLCYTFFNITFNVGRNLTTGFERLKNGYPKNVYQTQETLFDKMDS